MKTEIFEKTTCKFWKKIAFSVTELFFIYNFAGNEIFLEPGL